MGTNAYKNKRVDTLLKSSSGGNLFNRLSSASRSVAHTLGQIWLQKSNAGDSSVKRTLGPAADRPKISSTSNSVMRICLFPPTFRLCKSRLNYSLARCKNLDHFSYPAFREGCQMRSPLSWLSVQGWMLICSYEMAGRASRNYAWLPIMGTNCFRILPTHTEAYCCIM